MHFRAYASAYVIHVTAASHLARLHSCDGGRFFPKDDTEIGNDGGIRDLTIDELDAVSGGEIVAQGTVIKVSMDKGTLTVGYISTGGGPTLPYAKWQPK